MFGGFLEIWRVSNNTFGLRFLPKIFIDRAGQALAGQPSRQACLEKEQG